MDAKITAPNLRCSICDSRADSAEIERAISLLFQPGDVVEVRIPKTRAGVVAGYFDDASKMAAAIHQADKKYRAGGVYYVLNRINPALLGRAYNRLKEYAEHTTADNNILQRRWLPVDLDPVRPAGISASWEEHAAAIHRAQTIADDMAAEWERPIIADSGNGAHLLYRIDLPNDQETLAFVTGALAELDRRYSDDVVKVDVTSANSARIWKAYGTVARKGDNIPDRPHRVSRILEVPFDTPWSTCSFRRRCRIQGERPIVRAFRHGQLSRGAWVRCEAAEGLGARPGGRIYELAQCPFDSRHIDGSAAFTLLDGRPGFRCQHDGCRGNTIKDVFTRYPTESEEALRGSGEGESGIAQNKPKAPQSQLLIELAVDAELFRTAEGEAFASLLVGDHQEVWPLRSRGFRRWLTLAFYQNFGKPPGSQAMQDALAVLEARAQFDSPTNEIFSRVAPCGDGIYIDLCGDKWEAVEINPGGWRVVQNPPVRFRRSTGMLPLPLPAQNGSVSRLRGLINVGDDNNWILLLSWLVAALRPKGPYPVLILQGEQGSAKSTTAKLLRRIIDPATAPLRTPPRDERDLLIAANNSWIVAYDNLSSVQPWLSDALCRLATGGGFSTRQLYTDTEEVILNLTRPVILNGIDHLAERPDLADRAITLNLPRIEDTERRDEAQLQGEYELERPQILGGLFTAIAAGLSRLPETKLPRKPRMADFALWATAMENALGFGSGAFMSAYSGNRAEAVRETLESDPVSAAIIALLSEHEVDAAPWTGTSGDLLKKLELIVVESVKKSPTWPKTPRGLSGRLRRLATFLRESRIDIKFHDTKGTGGQRLLTITRTAMHLIATTAATASAVSVKPFNQLFRSDS